jgi:hypothetical protein
LFSQFNITTPLNKGKEESNNNIQDGLDLNAGSNDILNQTQASAFSANRKSTFQQINDFFKSNDHINAYNQLLGYDIQNPKKALN